MRKQIYVFCLMGLLLLALSGCIKGELKIEINPDGSGILSDAAGLNTQASALARSQVDEGTSDPVEARRQKANEKGFNPEIREWTDGEYNWIEDKISFESPDELNRMMVEWKEFNSFSLRKETGLLKNRFILDANFDFSDGEDFEEIEDMSFNPASVVDYKVRLFMPGEILETNGITDINSGALVWDIDFMHGTAVHAVSETWNWFNIGLMAGGAGLLGLMTIAGTGIALAVVWKKSKSGEPSSSVEHQPTSSDDLNVDDFLDSLTRSSEVEKVLEKVEAKEYLQQINQKLIKGRGQLKETSGGLRLSWPNGNDSIEVQVVDGVTIRINGTQYPATRQSLNDGLIATLKTMNKIKERR